MASRQSIFAASIVASALAVAAPAQATSFQGSGASQITDGTGAFYDSAIPAGLFTDTIDFVVPSAGLADIGVIYLQVLGGIENVTADLNGTAITFSPVGGSLYAGGLKAALNAGPQLLTISGFSNGNGSYSGNVSFSAVPEAATWLMMIAGVGFTGFAMRRRKSDYKVNFAF